MTYLDLNIEEIHEKLKSGEITSQELIQEAIKKAEQYQEKYNSFVTILKEFPEVKDFSNPLAGIPYAVKDNFSTRGVLSTAASNILKDYVPVYDATVISKLKEKQAILIGKTVLDELAMGGSGTTGHTGIVRNPWDENRHIGGSSAGSATSVALGIVPYALGSDTGDSIRKPAAFGGVVGYKPTYGRISRYGLFPFASSLDHVGCFTRCVKDTAYVIDALKGEDIKDMTTLPNENINYVDGLNKSVLGRKLFYFKEMIDIETTDVELKSVLDNFKETISKIKELGIEVESVSFDKQLLNAIFPTYFIISCAEATSNNANLTGILFGPRDNTNNIYEMMFNARTKGFSELIKRRFVIGSYVLQKENQEKLFLNACRVRRLIVEKMNQLFEKYDGLILPSSGGIAPLFGEDLDKLSERYLMLENHMAIGNFGGYPSITLPCGFINKMPIGINITGPAKKDQDVLNISYQIEKQLGYKNINAVRGVEK